MLTVEYLLTAIITFSFSIILWIYIRKKYEYKMSGYKKLISHIKIWVIYDDKLATIYMF